MFSNGALAIALALNVVDLSVISTSGRSSYIIYELAASSSYLM